MKRPKFPRREADQPPPQATRVIDASAGPPSQPPSDPAAARLEAWQEGTADASSGKYDTYSFSPGVVPAYVQRIVRRIAQLIASSKRDELDDQELQQEFVGHASAERTRAQEERENAAGVKEVANERKEFYGRVLRGHEPELIAWKAPERIDDSPRKTLAHTVSVPMVGLVVDGAWAYYALQVLGESTLATIAMAIVFGWAGVLVSHVAGVLARHARAGARRPRLLLVGVCALLLAAMGLFLADVRVGYLRSPITVGLGSTVPSGISQYHLSLGLVFVGWLAVNLALWIGVAVLAYQSHNPYVRAYQRACQTAEVADTRYIDAETSLTAATHKLIQALTRWSDVPTKWNAYREETGELRGELVEIWKHSLVSTVGDPEFTTAVERNVTDPTATEHDTGSEQPAAPALKPVDDDDHEDKAA